MIHRNKIFTNFATSNKDYPVHSSSGLGRRPLTAETRVRFPYGLLTDIYLIKYSPTRKHRIYAMFFYCC